MLIYFFPKSWSKLKFDSGETPSELKFSFDQMPNQVWEWRGGCPKMFFRLQSKEQGGRELHSKQITLVPHRVSVKEEICSSTPWPSCCMPLASVVGLVASF